MNMLLRRMGRGALTVHGFRSCFRDWCAEATTRPREVAEQALAHAQPGKVEAAYRRGAMLEKRRSLMESGQFSAVDRRASELPPHIAAFGLERPASPLHCVNKGSGLPYGTPALPGTHWRPRALSNYLPDVHPARASARAGAGTLSCSCSVDDP